MKKPGIPDDDTTGLELDWKGRTPPAERTLEPAPLARQAGPAKGLPGDPLHMSPELQLTLEGVFSGSSLTVRQIKEWGEILVGWETRNRYEVFDGTGRAVMHVGEMGGGFLDSLLRNFWVFRRIHLEFMTFNGVQVLTMTKPFTWFFRRFEIAAWDGRPLAVLQQRFKLLGRRFDVVTPGGAVVATIEGPLLKPWTFFVKKGEQLIATIRKQWVGLLKEAMTDADTFGVEFAPTTTDPRLRQIILAATLAIDLSYFEQRHNRRGGSPVGGFLFDD